ncbi:MAG: acyl-CoA thioesterase [Ruminococcus sp.]|nr:acyl-CoA thioesterase [Ruminococcus sp.]
MMDITPYRRRAYYYETDKMGIVHHSNYVRILEESRVDLMTKAGLPFTEVEQMGLMIPVLEVSLQYKFPLRFDDEFEVVPTLTDFNGCKFTVKYEINNLTTGKLALTAQTKHCFTDDKLMPVRLKKKFPEVYEKFSQYVEEV